MENLKQDQSQQTTPQPAVEEPIPPATPQPATQPLALESKPKNPYFLPILLFLIILLLGGALLFAYFTFLKPEKVVSQPRVPSEAKETSLVRAGEVIDKRVLTELCSDCLFYRVERKGDQLPSDSIIRAKRDNQVYELPSEFNKLLVEYNNDLTNTKSLIVAKSYILVSRPDNLSDIVFVDGPSDIPTTTKEGVKGPTIYADRIHPAVVTPAQNGFQVRIVAWSPLNGVLDEWEFEIINNQIQKVRRQIIDIGVGDFVPDVDSEAPTPGTEAIGYPPMFK